MALKGRQETFVVYLSGSENFLSGWNDPIGFGRTWPGLCWTWGPWAIFMRPLICLIFLWPSSIQRRNYDVFACKNDNKQFSWKLSFFFGNYPSRVTKPFIIIFLISRFLQYYKINSVHCCFASGKIGNTFFVQLTKKNYVL